MPRKIRNYRDEYQKYQGKSSQISNRSERNQARRELMKDGKVRKGDGKDVSHKRALSKGGSNKKGNLKAESASSNRSFSRSKTGALKSEKSKRERKEKKKRKY